ncbi:uncharacterized protein LOC133718923 [Rosa rugosa]|uniref:uncharacterized protein LOC133718923 n=1 Tax=Rosa rugosa TaxID=74645 RepID=UPI002B40EA7C|nr:uncharacterized protein LOC133718923 [Rosa rugosa]XP_062001784.1 uncharacterized protein LOC133718923 [Rosa rugosa]
MKRYYKKVSRPEETSSSTKNNVDSESSKKNELEAILDDLPSDPARRKRLLDYDPNIRDQVRRRYLLKGPCQPRNHEFPQKVLLFVVIMNLNPLIIEGTFFCGKHGIKIPNMDDVFVAQGKSQRRAKKITNLHHYRVEVFYTVIDRQLSDLNDRFNEVNSELLFCVASLSLDNLFSAFDKQKLLRLAKFYPRDFSERDVLSLEDKLDIYANEMRFNNEFSQLKGIGSLAKKLVETGKHKTHASVYKLLTLALVLPVATASVERVFSAMNIVKNPLRNRMGDQWMNDSLLGYIEKDIFNSIGNDAIMQRFQNMKSCRGQLPSRTKFVI